MSEPTRTDFEFMAANLSNEMELAVMAHAEASVPVMIERHLRECAAEAVREAGEDYFRHYSDGLNAMQWLREYANKIMRETKGGR